MGKNSVWVIVDHPLLVGHQYQHFGLQWYIKLFVKLRGVRIQSILEGPTEPFGLDQTTGMTQINKKNQ